MGTGLPTRATRKDPQVRFEAKWKLVQLLYRRGWDKQRIIDLFMVIDWMMKLPKHLKQQLWQNLETLEQEKKMAYVSSVERIGIEKGLQQGVLQGLQQGVLQGLEQGLEQGLQQGVLQGTQQGLLQGEALALQKLLSKRFGVIPAELAATIAAANAGQLDVWLDLVLEAPSLDAIFKSSAH